jgi:UDP-N-acetylglucosamine 3-dehydrogenase
VDEMKKVLVLGAGTMGTVHASAYAKMKGVKLAGIVDIRKDAADQLAGKTNSIAFYSFESALSHLKNNIDVIDVCLPTYLHKEFVLQAAGIVKNVICEKPLARNPEEAKEMIDYCAEKEVNLFVGHVVRFFPEYKRVKQMVEAKKAGTPAVVRTTRGGAYPVAWENWYGDFDKSGGLILDLLIHDFDFLRATFGEVERVFAKSLSRTDAEQLKIDYALITLRFKSGVIAHLEGTWAHEGFSSGIEISGDKGIIEYNSSKITPLKSVLREKTDGARGVEVPESPLNHNPYFLELEHFIKCIDTGEQPAVTAVDGLKAIEIAAAAQRSSELGRPVSLQSIINV